MALKGVFRYHYRTKASRITHSRTNSDLRDRVLGRGKPFLRAEFRFEARKWASGLTRIVISLHSSTRDGFVAGRGSPRFL
jgi:hypothetical protein